MRHPQSVQVWGCCGSGKVGQQAQRGGLEGRGLCSGRGRRAAAAGSVVLTARACLGPASSRMWLLCGRLAQGRSLPAGEVHLGRGVRGLLRGVRSGSCEIAWGTGTAVCGADRDAGAAWAGLPAPTQAALRSQPPAATRGSGVRGGSPRLTGSTGPDRTPRGPAHGWPQAWCHTTGSRPSARGPRGPPQPRGPRAPATGGQTPSCRQRQLREPINSHLMGTFSFTARNPDPPSVARPCPVCSSHLMSPPRRRARPAGGSAALPHQQSGYLYVASPPSLPEISMKTDVGNRSLPGRRQLWSSSSGRAGSLRWGLRLRKTLEPALASLPRRKAPPSASATLSGYSVAENDGRSASAVPAAFRKSARRTWPGTPRHRRGRPAGEPSPSRFAVGKEWAARRRGRPSVQGPKRSRRRWGGRQPGHEGPRLRLRHLRPLQVTLVQR